MEPFNLDRQHLAGMRIKLYDARRQGLVGYLSLGHKSKPPLVLAIGDHFLKVVKLNPFRQERKERHIPNRAKRQQRWLVLFYLVFRISFLIGVGKYSNDHRSAAGLVGLLRRLDCDPGFAQLLRGLLVAFGLESLDVDLLLIAAMIAKIQRSVLVGGSFADQVGRRASLRICNPGSKQKHDRRKEKMFLQLLDSQKLFRVLTLSVAPKK